MDSLVELTAADLVKLSETASEITFTALLEEALRQHDARLAILETRVASIRAELDAAVGGAA
jgi:hypothetical protein